MNNYQETAWLEGISGDHRGMRFPIKRGDIMIGRSQVCDLRIPKQNISRQHARIRYAEGKYYLQDQNSALGTLLNGRPVQASVLNDGDQITIGESIFSFNIQSVQPSGEIVAQEPDQVIQPSPEPAPQAGQGLTPRQQEDAIAYGGARAYAMTKSFVGKAWLTWALYIFGVGIVGFIFNIIYLNEANRVQRITGHTPPGKGCLIYLLVVNLLGLAVLIITVLVTGGAFLSFLDF